MLKFNNQTWFLDHAGLNHKVRYLGKWVKEDYLLYQTILNNKIEEYCYANGYDKHMVKGINPVKLWYKGDSINMIFEGSFFKGYNIKENIRSLRKHHQQIIDSVFHNNKSKYCDKMQIENPKIYRLDIGCNTNWKDLGRLEIEGRSNKLRKYYEDDDQEKVTGIQFGNRGRDYTHLRVYDKQYEKDHTHDYIRFGSADYVRMEYELGSRPIKNYGMRTLDDIMMTKYKRDDKRKFQKSYGKLDPMIRNWLNDGNSINNWESLLIKCHRTAIARTDHDNTNFFKMKAIPNFEYEQETKYYYKEQVKGIMEKYFEEKDIKWLRSVVDLGES